MTSAANQQKQVKAFQFIEGKPAPRPTTTNDDKENAPVNDSPVNQSPKRPQESPRFISPSKAFPSTPATRLPLVDLIGDTHNSHDHRAAAPVLPEEQIQWRAARSPRSASSLNTPVRKGRKRSRSSSPPSASQSSAAKRRRQDNLSVGLQEIKHALKTPTADPTADLWDRYNINSDRNSDLTNPLAGVNVSASPHQAGSGNVSGLRRWTSCGVEWPSSKRKRRAAVNNTLNHPLEAIADLASDPTHKDACARTSKMGSLLERIQESLTAQAKNARPDPEGPSSSSPFPDRKEQFDRLSISPCRGPELAAERADQSPTHARKLSNQSNIGTSKQHLASLSTSFGSGSTALGLLAEDLAGDLDELGNDNHTSAPVQLPPLAGQDQNVPEADEADDDDFGDAFDLAAEDFDDIPVFSELRPTEISDSGVRGKVDSADHGFDGLDGEDIDEDLFAAAEASATQGVVSTGGQRPSTSRSESRSKIQRYLVKQTSPGQYTNARGHACPEQVVSVEDEDTRIHKAITLRESWVDTRCTKGSFVHIIGQFDKHGQCTIDDSQNMLILHPDHLISALVVADSYSCIRKAVLQDRVKATSESSPPMLYGTIIHEIFQEAMQANRWEDDWLKAKIEDVVLRHIEGLYDTGLNTQQACEHLQGKIGGIQSWAETFVKARPDASSMVSDTRGKQAAMSVNKLLDVEEHIWSPIYGLKGNMDATVQVAMDDEAGHRTLTVPLEVKTGKRESTSHRAQTALYTLLLSDRYDLEVAYGVLYYVESGKTSRIPAVRHELRHLIMQRNELACYVRERLSLPPMLRNTHACNQCYAKTSCFLYHKLAEDGDGDTSGLRDKFDALTKHLGTSHQAFFKKWDDLLTKEESMMMKFRRELWTMLSHEREKLGRCFANVTLIPGHSNEDPAASRINRFSYTFQKHDNSSAFSFSESQITVGEPIVISDEQGHYALAIGYVTAISKTRVSVAVDRRLHNARVKEPGFDAAANQTFTGIMSVGPAIETAVADTNKPLLYRIDKDEYSNGMATTRNNLIQLMAHDAFRARELQSLIVDLRAPRFKTLPSSFAISGPPSQANLNADQRGAIDKILSAEDYALVLGMPGTGKTTTIAHIIRALVAKGKSVLLTSYTHTAVDNILLKIRSPDIPVLRLGSLAKIHPEVREFATLAAEPRDSIEELHSAYHDPPVVATTCLGVNHSLFQQRTFDYCIVDEASQITLPVCLGPVRMSRVFVLVGDHYQLPPLVQNREALAGGLDISLFRLLSETHPQAVATLSEQYRMSENIMRLSSTLIYNGRLKCGSATVARQRLMLPHFNRLDQVHSVEGSAASPVEFGVGHACPGLASKGCVFASCFAPAASPVTFLNTDTLASSAMESKSGARVTNKVEACITVELVRALLHGGLPASSLGIITLYRSQLALIKQELTVALAAEALLSVEAHTADRFQGRDKEVVIVSFVRSNDAGEVGELLRDWRRVNVAITRARRKLVLVGSRRTLEAGDEIMRKLVKLCEEGGEVVDMPCAWTHQFPITAVPMQTTPVKPQEAAPGGLSQRKALGPVSNNTVARLPPAKNPGYKNPLKSSKAATRVVQGQKPLSASAMKQRPVMTDIMREVIGDELDL